LSGSDSADRLSGKKRTGNLGSSSAGIGVSVFLSLICLFVYAYSPQAEFERAAGREPNFRERSTHSTVRYGTRTLLLVSSGMTNYQALIKAARSGVRVVEYDPATATPQSVIERIRLELGLDRVESIGIAAHDLGAGKFHLTGTDTVSLASVLHSDRQRAFWKELASFLAEGGRVDLFACNLACNDEGRLLVSLLEDLTGVNFAASSGLTGNQGAGGDWLLETDGVDLVSAYFTAKGIAGFSCLLASENKKITAPGASAGDYFGCAVAISGDYAIVGARFAGTGGTAYIFNRSTGGTDNWGLIKTLTASDAASGDSFGYSVAINGNLAVVGAPGSDDAGESSGAAYMFSQSEGGADNWGEFKKFTASDAAAGDQFGCSVAISGHYGFVGANLSDGSGESSGAAYIFYRNQGGGNKWGELKKLTASDPAAGDNFGYSVALSGDYAVVGAWGDDDSGESTGSAYVFNRGSGGPNNWGRIKKLTASDMAGFDQFGKAVAVAGDYAVVGAPFNDDGGLNSGSAYIFSRNQGGGDNWGEVVKITASDAASGGNFGSAVSVSGDYVVAGAHDDDGAKGAVYRFYRNKGGADAWGEQAKLTASDGAANDYLGQSVANNSNVLIGGALGDDDAGESTGAAYVFPDNLPPVISHTPVVSAVEGFAIDITATITDEESNPITATLYYRITGGGGYSSSSMSASGSDFTGTIPAGSVTTAGVDYYIEATDSINSPVNDGTSSSPHQITVSQQTGSLRVTIEPQGARDAGAQWRRVGTSTWYDGGATESGLPVGDYTVEFKDITNWDKPTNQPVTITYLGTATTTGTYTQHTGSLQVTIEPQGARDAGGQWRRTGTSTWYDGGATESGIPIGGYTVEFKDLANWDEPADQGVTITKDTTATATGTYTQHTGSLQVTIEPQGARDAGAQWRRTGTSTWYDSDATESGIPVGEYTVEFKDITYWDKPSDQGVTINKDTTATASGTYVPLCGSICVYLLGVTGGAWRVGGQTGWLASGDTASGLLAGTYRVEFLPVEGYTAPSPVDVVVQPLETTEVKAIYNEQGGRTGIVVIEVREVIVGDTGDPEGCGWRPVNLTGVSLPADTWFHFGEVVAGLPVGPLEIEFRPVSGYITPAEMTTNVEPDIVNVVNATYVRPFVAAAADYDGDGAPDLAAYNFNTRTWSVAAARKTKTSAAVKLILERKFGAKGCVPTPGDYDGDLVTDLSYWRPEKGLWRIAGRFKLKKFGREGDIPVPGDYNGDGISEPALFRPGTGEWFIYAEGRTRKFRFGGRYDVPVPGDFDGRAGTELAVYNVVTGKWRVAVFSDKKGKWKEARKLGGRLGAAGDIPVPADYDGDGKADIAIYRPAQGKWLVKGRLLSVLGEEGDIPVPADWCKQGKARPAVFRPARGKWLTTGGVLLRNHGEGGRPLISY
jgi:hypothetical protein